MKFVKKNQVIIAVIGLMLITAGYLNFTNTDKVNQVLETGTIIDSEEMASIGDAQLVSTKPANDSNLMENTNKDNEIKENNENTNTISDIVENEETDTVTETSTKVESEEYFTKSRLERDTMYSQMIESYQKILDKTNISEEQKKIAQKEITKINEQKNAIMITENLIKTKGFEDLVIFINNKSVNLIIKSKELKKEEIAQIQNIVTRELKTDINNIHISSKI